MTADLQTIQKRVWEGTIPLEISLAPTDSIGGSVEAYFTICPRLSYLPLLLDRLHQFFLTQLSDPAVLPSHGWFTYELVPLRWHFPVGLLYDLYSGASGHSIDQTEGNGHDTGGAFLPWKLQLHFSNWPSEHLVELDVEGKQLRDAFINSMKEASFLRTGTGKVAMSLGKEDSTALWQSVVENDVSLFRPVQVKLLRAPGVALRHIPLKIYLPASDTVAEEDSTTSAATPGHLRIIQTLVTPKSSSRQQQTLGVALNKMLPTLFPSRRSPLLASPVLHGAIVPLSVGLEDLAEYASYADGWLHLAIVMM